MTRAEAEGQDSAPSLLKSFSTSKYVGFESTGWTEASARLSRWLRNAMTLLFIRHGVNRLRTIQGNGNISIRVVEPIGFACCTVDG